MNRLIFSSVCFAFLCHAPATAATLAPHRAYYDLDVKRLGAGSGITNVKGKLAYEISGSACEGYAVNYRIAYRIVYSDGGPQVVDNQLASYESGDGLQLDVTLKQFLDSRLNTESRIKVTKDAETLPGKGLITTTDTKDFETAASTLFPARFQNKLIDAAAKGASRDDTMVFEGTDEEKSLRAISFIGAKRPVAGLPDKNAAELSSVAAWPVSISYYAEKANDDDAPVYQTSFLLLDNGISTDITLDFGNYALSGKLTKLELLKPATCP